MQPCDPCAQDDEAAAGELGAGGEVDAAERFTDVDVILDGKIELPRLAPAPHFLVVFGRGSDRDRLVRNVGDAREKVLKLGLYLLQLLFGRVKRALGLLGLLHQRFDVLPLGLRLADLLRDAVARGLHLFDLRLEQLAPGFQLLKSVQVERPRPARGQALRDLLGALAQQLDVDHLRFFSCSSFSRIFASRPRSVGRYHCAGSMSCGK